MNSDRSGRRTVQAWRELLREIYRAETGFQRMTSKDPSAPRGEEIDRSHPGQNRTGRKPNDRAAHRRRMGVAAVLLDRSSDGRRHLVDRRSLAPSLWRRLRRRRRPSRPRRCRTLRRSSEPQQPPPQPLPAAAAPAGPPLRRLRSGPMLKQRLGSAEPLAAAGRPLCRSV